MEGEVMDLKGLSSEELIAELERRRAEMAPPKLYYHGVWPGRSKCSLYDRHGRDNNDVWEASWRFSAAAAAANFPLQPYDPWDALVRDPSGSLVASERAPEEKRQGIFHYRQGQGISMICCWDRSGNPSDGSASAFVSPNALSREELLFWARTTYPDVFERMEAAGITIGWAT